MCLCFKKRGVVRATLVFALKRDEWSQQHWSLFWWNPTCTLHKGGRSNPGTIPPGESVVHHFLHPDDNGARSSKDPLQDVFPQILPGVIHFLFSHRAHKILTVLASQKQADVSKMAVSLSYEDKFAFTNVMDPWIWDPFKEDYHNRNRACKSYISTVCKIANGRTSELPQNLSVKPYKNSNSERKGGGELNSFQFSPHTFDWAF